MEHPDMCLGHRRSRDCQLFGFLQRGAIPEHFPLIAFAAREMLVGRDYCGCLFLSQPAPFDPG